MTLGLFLPLPLMPLVKILSSDVFHALNLRRLMDLMGSLLIFSKTASVLARCLAKLFNSVNFSTFPSCRKFAYNKPVPKKGDRSSPSNYHLKSLISCL